MILVLDIASSIEFWRQRYPRTRVPSTALPNISGDCACRARAIRELLPAWVDEDFLAPTGGIFHALSFEAGAANRFRGIHVHAWSGSVPEGAFYRLKDHVYVESPEFMFLHAATVLEQAQLIAFGDELCGLYSFDAKAKRGSVKRKVPLTTKSKIEQLLSKAIGCIGRKQALQALPFVIEGSASPMETFDQMTMCLPYRRGGYGLWLPQMNYEVVLSAAAARIARRNKCYLDMGYPNFHLDVEHHGKYDHDDEADKASDRARVNGLKEMGYEVVELTSDQVFDLFAYETIIKRLAGIMGKRLNTRHLGATPKRQELRKALCEWNDSSGRIR